MLERASPCIEPAAYIFLRRFEAPVRSHRLLGPAFWEHGGRQLDVPPWWPLYLNSIRKIPQAHREHLADGDQRFVPSTGPADHGTSSRRDRRLQFAPRNHATSRPFSQSVIHNLGKLERRRRRQEKGKLLGLNKGIDDEESHVKHHKVANEDALEQEQNGDGDGAQPDADHIADNGTARNQDRSRDTPISRTAQQRVTDSENELRNLIQATDLSKSETSNNYEKAWRLFVSLPEQERLAAAMLECLALSENVTDLDRAIQAYSIIPEEDKRKADYDAAVYVALKRNRHVIAAQICKQAATKDLAEDCRQVLLIHCLEKGLWRSAARIWSIHFQKSKGAVGHMFWMNHTPDRNWDIIDKSRGLPVSLSLLCRRLVRDDPVLALHKTSLLSLGRNLLYRIFQSTHIMGLISGTGVLQLLQLGWQLDLIDTNHYDRAFRALHSMHTSRNRADLAIMIFRNLRWRFPDKTVDPPVFGSLIEMCLQAGYPEKIFIYLLRQFEAMHGRADKAAYQRVMTALARQGDILGVQRQLKHFTQRYGNPESLDFVTPSLYAYARIGDATNARTQFNAVSEKYHLKPNTYCWNILMYAYARSIEPRQAFDVLDEMKQNGIEPDGYSFGILMGVAASLGDTATIYDLVDEARERGLSGVSAMIDPIVQSYCLNDEAEEAEKVVQYATTMDIDGSPVRMWNILLRHFAFRADSDAMLRIQQRMRELQVKPDGMTYAALMTALVVLGRTVDAAKILRTLHLSRSLTATSFHYAIILHGYAAQGNRDMVNIIYHEMEQRFPRVSPSARLAKLHTQAQRGLSKMVDLKGNPLLRSSPIPHNALDYLAEVLLETTNADMASKEPLPGFRRRRGGQAVPSIFIEFLVTNLASNGHVRQAERLLERYESLARAEYFNLSSELEKSIQLLTTRLMVACQHGQWDIVDVTWNNILHRALKSGTSLHKPSKPESLKQQGHRKATKQISDTDFFVQEVSSEPGSEFLSMIQQKQSALDQFTGQILPSQRLNLAVPLTQYIHALDLQRRQVDIFELVGKLQRIGFVLSTKNWNTYIQALCKSADQRHQLLAFELFDKVFLPNAPSWNMLRKGKWSDLSTISNGDDETTKPISRRRKFWERIRPDRPIPTYYTTIYLGTVLVKFHRQALKGDPENLNSLRSQYPDTLKLVQQIPYLRDRVQGVLLRGRPVIGDVAKRPVIVSHRHREGILGSKSPIDQIPLDELLDIEAHIAPDATAEIMSSAQPQSSRSQAIADKIDDKTSQSSPKSRILEETRDILKRQHLVASQETGDPPIGSIRRDPQTINPPVQGALLDPYEERLEKKAEQLRHVLAKTEKAQDTTANGLYPDLSAPGSETATILLQRTPRLVLSMNVQPREPTRYDTSALASRIVRSPLERRESKRERQAFWKNKIRQAERARLQQMGVIAEKEERLKREERVKQGEMKEEEAGQDTLVTEGEVNKYGQTKVEDKKNQKKKWKWFPSKRIYMQVDDPLG